MPTAASTIVRFPAHRIRNRSVRDDTVAAILKEAAAMFQRAVQQRQRKAQIIQFPRPAKGWALRRARDCQWQAKMAERGLHAPMGGAA